MKIIVFNRSTIKEVLNYSSNSSLERQFGKFIVISISDIDQEFPHFNRHPNIMLDVLYLRFGDTDDPYVYYSIHKDDSDKVAEFVNKYKNEIDSILVHCSAGISRSAGLAAALSLYLNNDDSKFFSGPYRPNRLVYRRVLKSLGVDL